jgi:hypothetical protein
MKPAKITEKIIKMIKARDSKRTLVDFSSSVRSLIFEREFPLPSRERARVRGR